MLRITTLLICTLFLAAQCTIEKRTFNKGYHVSWNRSLKNSKSEPQDLAVAEPELKHEVVQKVEVIAEPDPVVAEVVSGAVASNDSPSELSESEQILSENKLPEPDTVYVYPRNEPVGVVSFGFFSLGMLCIVPAFSSVIGFGILGAPFFFFVGLILGIISLARYKKSEFYKPNVFGMIGFIGSLVGLILVAFLIVLIIVALMM